MKQAFAEERCLIDQDSRMLVKYILEIAKTKSGIMCCFFSLSCFLSLNSITVIKIRPENSILVPVKNNGVVNSNANLLKGNTEDQVPYIKITIIIGMDPPYENR